LGAQQVSWGLELYDSASIDIVFLLPLFIYGSLAALLVDIEGRNFRASPAGPGKGPTVNRYRSRVSPHT
jgi:hypothetical protein